jgi:transcriptional regulator with XRE-family HTH domain
VPDDDEQRNHDDVPGGELQRLAPGVVDEWVAANIRLLREQSGMSQADLAEKMSALGWRFHPQTLHRIEAGQRKVTAGEADALARVLGATIERITRPEIVAGMMDEMHALAGRADEAVGQLVNWTRELLITRANMVLVAKSARERGVADDEPVREGLRHLEATLDYATLESAAEAGRDRFRRDYPALAEQNERPDGRLRHLAPRWQARGEAVRLRDEEEPAVPGRQAPPG